MLMRISGLQRAAAHVLIVLAIGIYPAAIVRSDTVPEDGRHCRFADDL